MTKCILFVLKTKILLETWCQGMQISIEAGSSRPQPLSLAVSGSKKLSTQSLLTLTPFLTIWSVRLLSVSILMAVSCWKTVALVQLEVFSEDIPRAVLCTGIIVSCLVHGLHDLHGVWCVFQGWDVGTLGNTLSGCITQYPRVGPSELGLCYPPYSHCSFGCAAVLSSLQSGVVFHS